MVVLSNFHCGSKKQKTRFAAESVNDAIPNVLRQGGRRFLLRLKRRSIRNNSWFRVLTLEKRRFIDVVIQTLEKIRSPLLIRLLTSPTEKLLQAIGGTRGLMGELAYQMQSFGVPLTQKISRIAAQWGNKLALRWADDEDFMRYLTVVEMNNLPLFRAGIKR